MAVSCERNGRSEGERSVFKGHGRDGEGGERSEVRFGAGTSR